MNKNNVAIYIVLPVYNEKKVVRGVIQLLQAQLFQNLIVVDDGSSEDIFSELADLPVHYLKHTINLGQGAALQTGFCYALQQGATVVVTFDADGQHDTTALQKLIAPILENKADAVLGSRFLNDHNKEVPFWRRRILQVARFVNFCVSGLWLTDAHNGLRAFSGAALQKITIAQNRMAHASEILVELKKNRLRIVEVPVTILYTAYARQKGQKNRDSLKVLFDLVLYKLFK